MKRAPDGAALQRERRYAIGRLLLVARRDFLERAARHARAAGRVPLPDAMIALLPHLELDGTRAATLAERTGLSKQRIARIVADMEASGLVRRETDAADARAVIIRYTPRGLDRLLGTIEAVRRVERDYAARIGAGELERLRRTLARIAYDERPASTNTNMHKTRKAR